MTHTLDAYGGTTQLRGKSTGWFHLEKLNGRRWFITPEGNALPQPPDSRTLCQGAVLRLGNVEGFDALC